MLTQTILDAQTTVELPAREMLAYTRIKWVLNVNPQFQGNVQIGLVNLNSQTQIGGVGNANS